MPTVTSYATLVQSILDWTHKANLASYVDYFIQAAQASIERDIPDLNFGNYIWAQEVSYGPFAINDGVTPVPSDWLGAKVLTVSDGSYESTLDVKAAAWIYDNYPVRTAAGVPAYVARDTWQSSYAQVNTFTATSGQTVFNLGSVPTSANMLLVSLDGASLSPGVSYTLTGSTVTLNTGATAGQVLAVQYLSTFSGVQTFTATPSQTSFQLVNPAASVVAVVLDGSVLLASTDYNVAGGFITLVTGASVGQVLVAYTSVGSVLIFAPYPDFAYTVQGTYYGSAPLLSSSQPTNWMVMRAPDMLMAACIREAATFLTDLNLYQAWDARYQQKLKALVDQDKAERWAASTLQVETG